jgi:hypothetical protein
MTPLSTLSFSAEEREEISTRLTDYPSPPPFGSTHGYYQGRIQQEMNHPNPDMGRMTVVRSISQSFKQSRFLSIYLYLMVMY